MTDIVEQLRRLATFALVADEHAPIMLDAADEIERLRREVRLVQDKLTAMEPDWHIGGQG